MAAIDVQKVQCFHGEMISEEDRREDCVPGRPAATRIHKRLVLDVANQLARIFCGRSLGDRITSNFTRFRLFGQGRY